jgi:hypothetical protein
MATPDVRVRLSADGIEDVLAAFRKIQAGASTMGQKTVAQASALSLFRTKVRELTGSLNALAPAASSALRPVEGLLSLSSASLGPLGIALAGIAVSVTAIATATKLAADEVQKLASKAEGIQNLAQSSGVSASNIQGLQNIVSDAGLSVDGLAVSLRNLNKAIASNDPALKQLGITSKDTFGALLQLADAFEGAADGPNKTAFATKLLGRSGEEMIPVLNRGSRAVRDMIEHYKSLGVVLTDEAVVALVATDEKFDTLGKRVEGLKNQLALLARPTITDLVSKLTDLVAKLNELPGAFEQAKQGLRELIAVQPGGQQLLAINDFLDRMNKLSHAIDELRRAKGDLSKFTHTGLGPPEVPGAFIGPLAPVPPPPDENAARKREAILRAALANELRLSQLHAKRLSDVEKQALEDSLVSLEESFRRRRKILEDAAAFDLKLLNDALRKAPAGSDQRADIQAQIKRRQEELAGERAQIAAEELDAARKLNQERIRGEVELLQAQGRRHEAAMIQIDQQVDERRKLLIKDNLGPEAAAAGADELRKVLVAREEFRQLQDEVDRTLADLSRETSRIQSEAAQGIVSEAEGEAQILALRTKSLPVLQEIVSRMAAIAAALKDPTLIAAVADLNAEIQGAAETTHRLDVELKNLGKSVAQAGLDSFADSLARIGREGNPLLSFLASFAEALQRIAAQILAMQLFKSLGLGKLLGLSGGGEVTGKASGGRIERRAGGGLIRGPGTDTSDSILTSVPHGSYIVRAAAVRKPGVLAHLRNLVGMKRAGSRGRMVPVRLSNREFHVPPEIVRLPGIQRHLEEINRGALQLGAMDLTDFHLSLRPPNLRALEDLGPAAAFAEGGLIGPSAASGSGSPQTGRLEGTLTVRALPGTEVVDVTTRKGFRILLQQIAANKAATNQALGR